MLHRPRYIGDLVRGLPIVEAPGITMFIPHNVSLDDITVSVSTFTNGTVNRFPSAVPLLRHQLSIFAASLLILSFGAK